MRLKNANYLKIICKNILKTTKKEFKKQYE